MNPASEKREEESYGTQKEIEATTKHEEENIDGKSALEKGKKSNSPLSVLKEELKFCTMLVHANIFLYSVCFGLSMPLMPYLNEELGGDPAQFGYLQTWFSLLQLIGSPILGAFGDRYGSKAGLLLSMSASALSYFLLGFAYSLELLFISRIPTLFQHGVLCSQAVITDITEEDVRAKSLGRIMLTYGIGFIGGPALGGILSQYSLRFPAFASGVISTISFISILLFMKNPPKRVKPSSGSVAISQYSINSVKQLSLRPNVLLFLLTRIVGGLASALFHAIFSVVAKDRYGLSPQENGMIMSLFGIVMAISQGVIVAQLTARYHELLILKGALLVMFVSFSLLTVTSQFILMLVIFIPLASSGVILSTVLSSALTKSVLITETSTILGLDMGCSSGCRVVAPSIALYLLQNYGYEVIPALSSALAIVAIGIISRVATNIPIDASKKLD